MNWAIIKGEKETGSTLHYMTEKPDNGDIVAQQAVPILPDGHSARSVSEVVVAAEIALNNCLPDLLVGRSHRVKQDLSKGAYFGGRKAEDGIIDWSQSAQQIHNLVRAVAPPYPGATTWLMGKPMRIYKRWWLIALRLARCRPSMWRKERPLRFAGSGVLRVVRFELDSKELSAEDFAGLYGTQKFEFNC